jgi:hypothetical protein
MATKGLSQPYCKNKTLSPFLPLRRLIIRKIKLLKRTSFISLEGGYNEFYFELSIEKKIIQFEEIKALAHGKPPNQSLCPVFPRGAHKVDSFVKRMSWSKKLLSLCLLIFFITMII